MKAEIESLLQEAKMDAVMVADQIDIMEDQSPLAIAAMKAIAAADAASSPAKNLAAENASIAWIEANEDKAIEILKERIGIRKVRGTF